MNKKAVKKGFVPYIFMFLFMATMLFALNLGGTKVNELSYDEFLSAMNNSNVNEIVITPLTNANVYQIKGTMKDYAKNESFSVTAPLAEEVMAQLLNGQKEYQFKMDATTDPASSTLLLFVINVLPLIILVGAGFFFISRQMGNANKSMDFGKSRARLNEDTKKVTFKDVAGLTEEKEEVQELIDFLKNPKKFTKLGARIPKGVTTRSSRNG